MTTPPPQPPAGGPPWSVPGAPPVPVTPATPDAGAWGAPPPSWGGPQPPSGPPAPYGAPSAYGVPPGYVYRSLPPNLANPWRRFGAMWLDALLAIVTLLIGWIIWDLVLWKEGQSPAKRILGMRIVRQDTGQPLDWGQSFVRNFLCFGLLGAIPFLGALYRIVGACFAFNDDRQALWDKMASTYVLDERGRTAG